MKEKSIISLQHYESPCGIMLLGSFDGKLCLCDWMHGRKRQSTDMKLMKSLDSIFVNQPSDVIVRAAGQLDEFFSGKRREFDIPLLFVGTDFQKKVWRALMDIGFGNTVSYAGLAERIGHPSSVRAVANANANNPISVFAPCHRVIGADGSLTGYGGGLDVKKYLLDLESGNRCLQLKNH